LTGIFTNLYKDFEFILKMDKEFIQLTTEEQTLLESIVKTRESHIPSQIRKNYSKYIKKFIQWLHFIDIYLRPYLPASFYEDYKQQFLNILETNRSLQPQLKTKDYRHDEGWNGDSYHQAESGTYSYYDIPNYGIKKVHQSIMQEFKKKKLSIQSFPHVQQAQIFPPPPRITPSLLQSTIIIPQHAFDIFLSKSDSPILSALEEQDGFVKSMKHFVTAEETQLKNPKNRDYIKKVIEKAIQDFRDKKSMKPSQFTTWANRVTTPNTSKIRLLNDLYDQVLETLYKADEDHKMMKQMTQSEFESWLSQKPRNLSTSSLLYNVYVHLLEHTSYTIMNQGIYLVHKAITSTYRECSEGQSSEFRMPVPSEITKKIHYDVMMGYLQKSFPEKFGFIQCGDRILPTLIGDELYALFKYSLTDTSMFTYKKSFLTDFHIREILQSLYSKYPYLFIQINIQTIRTLIDTLNESNIEFLKEIIQHMPDYIHGKTIDDIKKALKKSTVSKELKDEILQLLPKSNDSVDWLKLLRRQLQRQQQQQSFAP